MKRTLVIFLGFGVMGVVGNATPVKAFYLNVPSVFRTFLAEEPSLSPTAVPPPSFGTESRVLPPAVRQEPSPQPTQPMNGEQNRAKELPIISGRNETNPATTRMDTPVPSLQNGEVKPIELKNEGIKSEERSNIDQPERALRDSGAEGSRTMKNEPRVSEEGSPDRRGPDEAQQAADQKRNDERQMRDMKRGVKDMERNLAQFERMVKDASSKGITLPADVAEKVAKVRSALEGMKNASTVEELNTFDFGEVGEMLQALEEIRREVYEGAQRMQEMRRNMKNMEQGLKMFERSIAKLEQQKIPVPPETKGILEKVKTIVTAVKNAKSWDEMLAAGIEDLRDLMDSLQEQQGALERLSRWPQTLKQIDRELTRLNQALQRAKITVANLNKKGIDLMSVYAEFETAIGKIKTVRNNAVSNVSAGQIEEAFDAIENDFFGQMEDTWQYQRVIETMGNMGRFNADFKRGIMDAEREVRDLKRRKMNTSELEQLLANAKEQGQEVANLMKARPIDEEAILSAIQELENMKVEFENTMDELTGSDEDRPWEKQGPQAQNTFQTPRLPSEFDKMVPKK